MNESGSAAGDVDIVIAEDSRIQSKILQKHLVQAGYEVRAAPDGAAALDLIRDNPPTLIISDIEMPEMTGYELCRAVKGDPGLRHIPVILLSTLSSPEDIIVGLQAGADNYVTKPYDPPYLLSRVESLLNTPIDEGEADGPALEVTLAGKRHTVRSGRQQVLNLLISTFENAVEKNNELIRVNNELTIARDKLTEWNQQLEQLNTQLESANTRMSHDLAAAAKVQQSLLPSTDLAVPHAEVTWRYVPCDELAGDFLNYFLLDDTHLAMYVVDVSGHGVASSLLAVTIGRLLTAQATSSSLLMRPGEDGASHAIVPPADVLAELNRRFPMEEQGGLYFTIAYGVLDLTTHTLCLASGGHTPIVVIGSDGQTRLFDADGISIGWMEDMEFENVSVQLVPGDRVYFYSDGVPEAMDPDLNEFGDARMLEEIVRGRDKPLSDATHALLNAVLGWCNPAGPKDDVSILAVEIAE